MPSKHIVNAAPGNGKSRPIRANTAIRKDPRQLGFALTPAEIATAGDSHTAEPPPDQLSDSEGET
jgi:hypothetical protein